MTRRLPKHADPLTCLAAQHAAGRAADEAAGRAGDPVPADPDRIANDPYFDWLAREATARQTPPERRAVAARADEWARRMIAAGVSLRLPVVRISGPPVLYHDPAPRPVAEVLAQPGRHACVPALDFGVAAGVGRDVWDVPCASWVELPDGVSPGRYVALGVDGRSMEPLLHDGDTILVQLDAADALPVRDTVVVARHPDDGYVVKRVHTVGRRSIRLESVNPAYGGIDIPRRPGLVLGRVVAAWCAHEDDV
jgi:hypothetical protein